MLVSAQNECKSEPKMRWEFLVTVCFPRVSTEEVSSGCLFTLMVILKKSK